MLDYKVEHVSALNTQKLPMQKLRGFPFLPVTFFGLIVRNDFHLSH